MTAFKAKIYRNRGDLRPFFLAQAKLSQIFFWSKYLVIGEKVHFRPILMECVVSIFLFIPDSMYEYLMYIVQD